MRPDYLVVTAVPRVTLTFLLAEHPIQSALHPKREQAGEEALAGLRKLWS